MQSLAPLEFFEGIKFNYSFYTTGDTKVTLEYVNNNFLKCTGYAYSRAISTSFNGIIYALGGIEGSGAGLTNLNASNISTGTLNDVRIPTLAISKTSGLQAVLDSKQATLTGTSIVNVSNLTTTFLTTTKMNGVKNTTFLTSFQNICLQQIL